MKNISNVKALTIAVAVALAPLTASAGVDFGKRGEAVDLVIGYQPYYTESWTGVVNNGKSFWKNHLPAGSTAEFQVGLQGSVIVNAMAGEKQHIGYMGDMPAIASTFKYLPERGGTDIRIVAALGTSKQQCNIFLVRNDAPQFANGVEAVKWMDGKVTSAPHGACTDRFAQLAFKKAGIKPAKYLNQNIEVITTNFRAGKLDAAAIWEPTASKMVSAGIARRAASGEDFGAQDGAFMVMLNDLISQRPDAVMGWLEAELDAQELLLTLQMLMQLQRWQRPRPKKLISQCLKPAFTIRQWREQPSYSWISLSVMTQNLCCGMRLLSCTASRKSLPQHRRFAQRV